jgi:hypothetical protein
MYCLSREFLPRSPPRIDVLSTQAPQEAYLELVAQFEKASGHKVKIVCNGTLNVQKRLNGLAYTDAAGR